MLDTIVVGAGVMGAATTLALARRGREVVALERFTIGHTHGSSHGDARVYRYSYDDERWVRLMAEAIAGWRALERASGETLLHQVGGVDIAPPGEHAEALRAGGVPFEVAPGAEAMARYPSIAVPEEVETLLQEQAGWVAAERAWRAFVSQARLAGAEVREGAAVERIEPGEGSARVHLEGETLEARDVIVAAGAWSRSLLAPAGVRLPVRVTVETPAFFANEGPVPPIVVDWRPSRPIYALPSPDYGVKAAEHHAGAEISDLEGAREVSEGSVERLTAWVAERFPEVDPVPLDAQTCLYTSTEDEDFIIERHGPIVVVSACSGHAFKFAPAIGAKVADLLERAP